MNPDDQDSGSIHRARMLGCNRAGGVWSLRTLYLINCTFAKKECYEEDLGGGILL